MPLYYKSNTLNILPQAHCCYAIITDMEPETSLPKLGPEQVPARYDTQTEHGPVLPSPETGINTGSERVEQAAEGSSLKADSTGAMTALSLPVAADDSVTADSPIIDDNPIIARDDDLIEKEWVDKAKKIISDTKDDPYRREEAVSLLQKDYLKKRYGRELGMAD